MVEPHSIEFPFDGLCFCMNVNLQINDIWGCNAELVMDKLHVRPPFDCFNDLMFSIRRKDGGPSWKGVEPYQHRRVLIEQG